MYNQNTNVLDCFIAENVSTKHFSLLGLWSYQRCYLNNDKGLCKNTLSRETD